MNKFCSTCAIYLPQHKTCQFMPMLQGTITPEDYCSQYKMKEDLIPCEICGNISLNPIIEYDDAGETFSIMCPQCHAQRDKEIF